MMPARRVSTILFALFLMGPIVSGEVGPQPVNQSDENMWVVWVNEADRLHMNTMSEFRKPKQRVSEPGAGTSTELLKNTKVLGPFPNKEEAMKALEQAVTEVEERTYRNAPYLVAKIGGKEYRVGSEVKFQRIPLARFPPQYLIHITRTSTMNGPVDKDGYMMHHEPPQDRKFQTADGSGGVFHNEGDLVGGPYTTNFELCPVLKGLGQKGIELCSPYGRWVSCDDPRWQGHQPTRETLNEPPRDQGATQEPAIEWDAKEIVVRVELDDEDDQLVPADEALLHFEIKNASRKVSLSAIKVEAAFQGDFRERGVIRFLAENAEGQLTRSNDQTLGPGNTWKFDARIRVAGETNEWIYRNLMQTDVGGRQDDQKPSPEKGVELKEAIQVKVSGELQSEAETRRTKRELFEGVVAIWKGEKVQRLCYPDLTNLAGMPPGSPDNIDYYRRGDLYFSHPGNQFVRAIAFRAARYGGSEKALLPKKSIFADQLSPLKEQDPNGPLFPENDVQQAVHNVVKFLHQALMPKKWPKTLLNDHLIAEEIWLGRYGPGKENDQGFFICQEHSYLLGSLLRALGICVREVNFLVVLPWFVNAQDAASEMFYNGDWHFYGLFDARNVFTDHRTHYARWNQAYGMWVGIRRWTESKPRFAMNSWTMNRSEVWQFSGYGDRGSFVATSEPPLVSWIYPYLAYEVFSPVAATVVLPDGRRIGALSSIDPNGFLDFLLGAREKPAGIVNEVPGAYYYPEGLTFYSDVSNPASGATMPQTIVVPAKDAGEWNDHRIVLTGIGEGPYAVRLTYFDAEGRTHAFRGIQGQVKPGQRVEHSGSAFQRIPDQGGIIARDLVLLQQTPWKVEVEIDWIADALVARAMGPEGSDPSITPLVQRALQAAVPGMVAFLRTVEIKNGVTFGKVMKDAPDFEDRIKGILLHAQVRSVERKKEGEVRIDLGLPMRALREALPPGQYP